MMIIIRDRMVQNERKNGGRLVPGDVEEGEMSSIYIMLQYVCAVREYTPYLDIPIYRYICRSFDMISSKTFCSIHVFRYEHVCGCVSLFDNSKPFFLHTSSTPTASRCPRWPFILQRDTSCEAGGGYYQYQVLDKVKCHANALVGTYMGEAWVDRRRVYIRPFFVNLTDISTLKYFLNSPWMDILRTVTRWPIHAHSAEKVLWPHPRVIHTLRTIHHTDSNSSIYIPGTIFFSLDGNGRTGVL